MRPRLYASLNTDSDGFGIEVVRLNSNQARRLSGDFTVTS